MCRYHAPEWQEKFISLKGTPLTEEENTKLKWLYENLSQKPEIKNIDEARKFLLSHEHKVKNLRKEGTLMPLPNLNDPDFSALCEKYKNNPK